MWKISQVEALTGLPRRDIQRVCDPNSNVYSVKVKDSKHGRRFFDREELAQIYLIKQFKDMGYNLKQIRYAFESVGDESKIPDIIDLQISELETKRSIIEEQLEQAKDFRNSLNNGTAEEACEELIAKRFICSTLESMLSTLESLLSPEEPDEFEEAFLETLGHKPCELRHLPLKQWGDSLPEGTLSANERVAPEYLQRINDLLANAPSPVSQEAQDVITETLRLMSIKDPEHEDRHTAAITLLSILETLKTSEAKLFFELILGSGGANLVKEALLQYLSNLLNQPKSVESENQ